MRLALVAVATAVLAMATVPATAVCPTLDVKAKLRRTLAGGKLARLVVRISSRDLFVSDGGLMLTLPNGVAYHSVRVSPKLSSAPVIQQNGRDVAWTGINLPAKKARAFKVKLAIDQCAGDALVPSKHNKTAKAHRELTWGSLYSTQIGVSVFTGTVASPSCHTNRTVTRNIRRPKTATNCTGGGSPIPPTPPAPSGNLCALSSGTAGALTFYGCQTAVGSGTLGNYAICDSPTVNSIGETSAQECFDFCNAQVVSGMPDLAAVEWVENFVSAGVGRCGCFQSGYTSSFTSGSSDAFVYTLAPANPTLQDCGGR